MIFRERHRTRGQLSANFLGLVRHARNTHERFRFLDRIVEIGPFPINVPPSDSRDTIQRDTRSTLMINRSFHARQPSIMRRVMRKVMRRD